MVRCFIVKILAMIVAGVIIFGDLSYGYESPSGSTNRKGCYNCHPNTIEIHHGLISVYSCEYCHLVWDDSLNNWVFVDQTDCFSCHDGVHHKHNYK